MNNTFLAIIFRMRYIDRWSLMYNTQKETLSNHTIECAFIAHFLACVGNKIFHKNYDCDKLAVYALFHDVSEVLTGDLPTPIKYFNDDIKKVYKEIEKTAVQKLLNHLPDELSDIYSLYLKEAEISDEDKKIIKISDKLCAYIKCITELNAGNKEFQPAYSGIRKEIESFESEELKYFLDNCLYTFSLSLDELKGML